MVALLVACHLFNRAEGGAELILQNIIGGNLLRFRQFAESPSICSRTLIST